MERARFHNLLLAGALTFSQSPSLSVDNPQAIQTSTNASTTAYHEVLPLIAADGMSEIEAACNSYTILYADGLSGSENGHLDRAFFKPVAAKADTLNVSYQTVFPENRVDPEKDQWTNAFIQELTKASLQDKKTILMGYSMGSREILGVVATLIDPTSGSYNPSLLKNISALIFIAGRDNNGRNALEHPELPHYRKHYTNDTVLNNPTANISISALDLIGTEFKDRMFVVAEPGDDIVPASQSFNLAQQLGAVYISVDVKDESGKPDSHFAIEKAGFPISEILNELVSKDSCKH